jgi:hypothetical protein
MLCIQYEEKGHLMREGTYLDSRSRALLQVFDHRTACSMTDARPCPVSPARHPHGPPQEGIARSLACPNDAARDRISDLELGLIPPHTQHTAQRRHLVRSTKAYRIATYA